MEYPRLQSRALKTKDVCKHALYPQAVGLASFYVLCSQASYLQAFVLGSFQALQSQAFTLCTLKLSRFVIIVQDFLTANHIPVNFMLWANNYVGLYPIWVEYLKFKWTFPQLGLPCGLLHVIPLLLLPWLNRKLGCDPWLNNSYRLYGFWLPPLNKDIDKIERPPTLGLDSSVGRLTTC